MASLTFKHIYKKYPGKPDPAVNDFNLEIKDGEFVSVEDEDDYADDIDDDYDDSEIDE